VAYLAIFYRLILRPLARDTVRTALTIAAVALGVAVVLAIELAGEAAAGSFRSSVETLAGSGDFEVTATGGVTAEVLTSLALLPYPLRLRPRIEDYAVVAATNRVVPFIGVDMLSDNAGSTENAGASEFQRGGFIWTGKEAGWKAGQRVRLVVNDEAADYTVRGIVDNAGDAIVTDLAPAARLLRRGPMLDRILIDVPASRPLDQWESILRAALPAGVTLAPQGARTAENRRMLGAFRWNLRVLSYIALVVGAFLIYNTISVSVVRRREEIGIMRALGATRVGVLGAFLLEAACLGLAGGVAGVALGRLMATGSVRMVAATVESLYVSSTPAPIALTLGVVLAGVGIGVLLSVVSAAAPAWEASRVTPVEAMARGRRDHAVRMHQWRDLACGAALALAAWWASRQPPAGGKPLFGYLAALLLIAGSALATPALVSAITRTTGVAAGRIFGVEALLASRSLAGSLRRTAVLVGALSTSIAMLSAVGIMVGSFRQTVLLWMADRLQADLYLRPAGPPGADRHPTLAPDIATRLEALPEVADVDQFRAYEISYQGMPATLGGGDARIAGRYGRRTFLSGARPSHVFAQLLGHDRVIVSEAFANKHGVRLGDTLELTLGERHAVFRVIDIYGDYSNERGFIIMDRGTLLKYLPDPAPSNVAVYLRPGVALETGRGAVESALARDKSKALVFTNRALREEAIRVFDRTFAITYALEAVAVLVAVMGVAGALLALVIDRRREFGLLRFLGGATGQIRRIILFEAGLLGLFANIAGMVLGFWLSLLLIYVINRQSFGWTIQFHWPVAVLVSALSLVYAATLLAALYPSQVAAKLVPIEVVHED
jgi:putative ABC transport system permease protein